MLSLKTTLLVVITAFLAVKAQSDGPGDSCDAGYVLHSSVSYPSLIHSSFTPYSYDIENAGFKVLIFLPES